VHTVLESKISIRVTWHCPRSLRKGSKVCATPYLDQLIDAIGNLPLPDHDTADPFPIMEPVTDVAETEMGDTSSESSVEVVEETALEHFSAILQQAQQLAMKAEKDQHASRKRPVYYTGKSKRTEYRRKKARRDLATKGFLSLQEFAELRHPSR
jgi:5-methylcytosine-specific restriction endonuclease McrA